MISDLKLYPAAAQQFLRCFDVGAARASLHFFFGGACLDISFLSFSYLPIKHVVGAQSW